MAKIIMNDDAVHPVIGTILMIAITVIICVAIAGFIISIINFNAPSYNATITVHEITTINDKTGIIDTDGNGYYWMYSRYDFNPFIINRTYLIEYTIINGERHVQNKHDIITEEVPPEAFKCRLDPTGVCK